MTNALIILSILTAAMALFVEIRCTELSARVVWLGSLSLFYLINLGFYLFVAKGMTDLTVPKRVLILILVGMGSAIFSMITATVIIGLTVKKTDEEKAAGEEDTEKKPEDTKS
ncbi:MAG: hypothetical protein IK096_04305 [Lachnospiraceae bacterium]|nr:hypothetical protein [Lachnospiraceae bacterium]